jgi:hypothetical protein
VAKEPDEEFLVTFPVLWVAIDWAEAHCVIPDGFRQGEAFELYPWQLWCTANHYRVKPSARRGQLATAFHNRRSQIVGPQKLGKGPWAALLIAMEAAGPVVFAGWAEGGELYQCSAWGCGCGWVYEYEPGEPMGMPWPTPLIQLTATSEDQTDNTYRPLQMMIRNGPLSQLMRVGEDFTRVGENGRIDVVTSNAQSRLGQPLTFALQDETGLYTKANGLRKVAETQRRGLAGMGGRSIETTNAWDPGEDSVAQSTAESARPDIFKFHRLPPKHLSYRDKRERARIHRHVYAGSPHVDLDGIEAEAAELLERDPAQAERFFGNRIVAGLGAYMDPAHWEACEDRREVPDGAQLALAFDGSDVNDWTGIRLETGDGYQFTPVYGPDRLPCVWDPAEFGGQVPRLEVDAAVRELYGRYDIARGYFDPPYWETEIDQWAEDLGERKVIRWYTSRVTRMHPACERLLTDVAKADTPFSHDGCRTTRLHMGNARKSARPGGRYVLAKPSDAQKIDLCVVSVMCHQAAGDATAAGEFRPRRQTVILTGSGR